MNENNKVTLKVGGFQYNGWTDVQIGLSLKAIAGTFSIGLTEKWPCQKTVWPIQAGEFCELFIGNDPVISGYVDIVDSQYDANVHSLIVSGRDKTGDLVDCTVDPQTLYKQTYGQIIRSLVKPYGIEVIDETDTSKVLPRLVLEPGDTVFSVLDQIARAGGFCLISSGTGQLLVTTAQAAATCSGSLELGVNILKASCRRDFSNLYSQIIVSSQISGESANKYDVLSTQPKAELKRNQTQSSASQITRYRPLRIIAETQSDAARCLQRAQWEVAHREAEAFELSVTVQGWRQVDGKLWRPNTLIKVVDSLMRVNETLLISDVRFNLSDSGTTTDLTLQPQAAFVPCPQIPDVQVSEGADKYQVV